MGVTIYTKHYQRQFDLGYGTFNNFREKIASFVPKKPYAGTISFLEQSDCGGKLTPNECKELLMDIAFMEDDGHEYGYIGSRVYGLLTLSRFREMLKSCVRYRCNLYWS